MESIAEKHAKLFWGEAKIKTADVAKLQGVISKAIEESESRLIAELNRQKNLWIKMSKVAKYPSLGLINKEKPVELIERTIKKCLGET